jgi:hypothetical protein
MVAEPLYSLGVTCAKRQEPLSDHHHQELSARGCVESIEWRTLGCLIFVFHASDMAASFYFNVRRCRSREVIVLVEPYALHPLPPVLPLPTIKQLWRTRAHSLRCVHHV